MPDTQFACAQPVSLLPPHATNVIALAATTTAVASDRATTRSPLVTQDVHMQYVFGRIDALIYIFARFAATYVDSKRAMVTIHWRSAGASVKMFGFSSRFHVTDADLKAREIVRRASRLRDCRCAHGPCFGPVQMSCAGCERAPFDRCCTREEDGHLGTWE
jgi:hypothetical protein